MADRLARSLPRMNSPDRMAAPSTWRRGIPQLSFPHVGPGFLVAAAFVGPGTVTTALDSGARWGLSLGWVIVLSTLTAIVLHEMAARLGTLTGQGLGEMLRRQSRSRKAAAVVTVMVVAAIGFGNAAYQTGNLIGGGLGIEAFLSLPVVWGVLPVAVLASALLWSGSYKAVERCLIGLVATMGVVFLLAALLTIRARGIMAAELVPTASRDSLVSILALIGTTIVPYNVFLHASAASRRWSVIRPRSEGLRRSRIDSAVGIAVGGLVTAAIFTVAALAMPGGRVESVADMAGALQPVLGDSLARWLLGIGLFAAGLTSAITAPLAAAYAVCGVCGWSTQERSAAFRGVWGTIMALGVCLAVLRGSSPTETILLAQAANALVLPVIAGFLLMACNARLLGKFANGRFANAAALLALVVIVGLSIWKIITIFI